MNICDVCSAQNALYLTIKNGGEIKLCQFCAKESSNKALWDNPEFWATQVNFE